MPKSKLRKNHKKKVAARRESILQEKRKREKFQKEFIMKLIKEEQEKGMFDNTTPIEVTSGSSGDGPIIDGPIIDGPQINL